MSTDQTDAQALDIARALVAADIPVFTARPALDERGEWDPVGGSGGCGYWLPKGWQHTRADPARVEEWRPGMALCAVMGHGLDLLDVDPRNGGDKTRAGLLAAGMWPTAYGVAETPSGGTHEFVAPLGVGSRDGVRDGLDVKAGTADGAGRGFAFIAPTVKLSKTTGELTRYRWASPPDLDVLAEGGDESGEALAEMVRRAKSEPAPASPVHQPEGDEARPWLVAETIPVGSRYPWLRSYAGWLRHHNTRYAEARALMRARWQACAQPDHYPMPWADAESLLKDIYGRYAPAVGDFSDLVPAPDGATSTEHTGDAMITDRLAALRSLLVDSAGLDAIPDPEPVIDGVLFRDSLAWAHGKPGSGKSFVSLDWAGSIATGRPWQGHGISRPGPVVYLVAEGVTGVRQRVRAWEDAAGRPMDGVKFLPVAVQLLSPTDRDAFVALVAELAPVLVVIDTQARVTVGADENSAQDMGRLVAAADAIREATGACVLLVHHEARSGDTLRGSTALEGAATTLVRITKDGAHVRVDCTKQKDAEPFPPVLLRLVPRGAGAVLESHSGAGHPDELAGTEQRLLTAIRDSFGTSGATSTQLRDVAEVPKSSFYRALKTLLDKGFIRNTGTERRPLYMLAEDADAVEVPSSPTRSHETDRDRSHVPHPFRGGTDGTGTDTKTTARPKSPCRSCGNPQWNAAGSPYCRDCRASEQVA